MLIAIAPSGTGQVVVEEFRVDATTAAALTAFCSRYSPPRAEADYIAYDTGWTSVQEPVDGNRWSYDHDTPALVETALPIETRFHAASKLVDAEIAITQDTTWQDLGGVVTTIGAFVTDASKAVGRCVGRVKSSGAGAELRVVKVDLAEVATSLMTAVYSVGDLAGAWGDFNFSTDQPPELGQYQYCLQGRLNGATSASVQFASMSLLEIL